MIARALVVLSLVAMPAAAQMSPTPGILKAPPKGQSTATPAPAPPVAAPRTAVQQVAPFSSAPPAPTALGHSALGHSTPGKPTPVVQPPKNTHAQKPPPPKHAAPSTATTPATAKVPPPAPVVAPPPAPEKSTEPTKGTVTGLPLPRWASLRSDEVNLRAGPGTRYPVDWVYRRHDLPVEIEREFEVWRLIRDQDGYRGWVHAATLTGRRSFVVEGADRLLRSSPSDDAAPVALLKAGVVGRIRSCEPEKSWCDMQVGDYRGWLKRDQVWGAYPNEAVN